MHLLIFIFTIICLVAITYQDLKSRSIHLVWVVLLFICGILLLIQQGSINWLSILLFSFLFLIIQGLAVVLVYKFFIKKETLILNRQIGIGDVIFYLACIPFFTTVSFILFYISSLLFSAVVHLLIYHRTWKIKSIPLAGYAAILLMIVLCVSQFYDVNLYQDAQIIHILENFYD